MDLELYKTTYSADDAAPGWAAIDQKLDAIYPGVEPRHMATLHKYMLGGPDPLDGISIYRCGSESDWHYHYVTYGFSTLYYDEEASQKEHSGFGFELTFRLQPSAGEAEWPVWPCNLLQNLARYVFKSGNWFDDYHWVPANGPIRQGAGTAITGLAFVTDPELGRIDTPHGQLQFLQVVGITEAELEAISAERLEPQALIESLQAQDRLLVTDLARTASVAPA